MKIEFFLILLGSLACYAFMWPILQIGILFLKLLEILSGQM